MKFNEVSNVNFPHEKNRNFGQETLMVPSSVSSANRFTDFVLERKSARNILARMTRMDTARAGFLGTTSCREKISSGSRP
jgi:hypothetical protein